MKESTGEKDFISFRYQGQYEDVEIGLYYNRFRYYDPEQGNYTQIDPFGLAGNNPSLYGYTNDPNTMIDPLGLATRPNSGKYHIFHDFMLDPRSQYSSDKVQFKRANKAFINKLNSDSALRREMLGRYPALHDWLKNPDMG